MWSNYANYVQKYNNVHGSVSQRLIDQDVPMARDLTSSTEQQYQLILGTLMLPVKQGSFYLHHDNCHHCIVTPVSCLGGAKESPWQQSPSHWHSRERNRAGERSEEGMELVRAGEQSL